jgi:hypothetical protein
MSETLRRVQALVAIDEIEVSQHGFRKLASNGILLEDVVVGVGLAVAIEDYPAAFKGPSVLALQHDSAGHAIHVVWGMRKGARSPAVMVTAYRPDPRQWSADFVRRKP